MYLGNPLLPVNYTAASAEEIIRENLEKKNWHKYEQKKIRLNLVPYFLFNYHYFLESETGTHKIVKNSIDGILAVDGHEVAVREDLVELIKNNWKKALPEVPKTGFDEKWCNIEKKEQEEILKVKTAEHFGVPKTNVYVSSARKLYVPLYKTSVTLAKKEYPLIINAVDGSITEINNIPEREKGYFEITKETIEELKKPQSWIKYSKEAITETSALFSSRNTSKKKTEKRETEEKNTKRKKLDLSFFESKAFLALIIIIALILLAAALAKA